MHMASIRTARVLAAVSALPLTVALFAGVAAAGNGSFADNGSNVGSGVGRDNSGNSSTSQQQAIGSGASNQNNTAQVNGFGLTAIDQRNAVVNFADLW
jgi:hypothetical protein